MSEQELITDRVITYDENGAYSDVVTLKYLDAHYRDITFYIQPERLYNIVRNAIEKLAHTKDEYNPALTPDMNMLKKRIAGLVRACIRGGLAIWGDDLLTTLYGKKDHPRPPKKTKVDLLDWYMDQFAQIAIASLMRYDTIFTGSISTQHDEQTVITVLGVDTRPVANLKEIAETTGSVGTVPETSTIDSPGLA